MKLLFIGSINILGAHVSAEQHI